MSINSDKELAERVYDKLVNKGIPVFWDAKSLLPGQPWEDGFVNGLNESAIYVPVLSKAALASYAELTPESNCDNVLLEQLLALELKKRDDSFLICPVFVGELENHLHLGGDIYTDFFRTNGIPTCPEMVVEAVGNKLLKHLRRIGKGAPQLPQSQRTVKGTLDAITSHQGVFLRGIKRDATELVVNYIASASGDPTFLRTLQQTVARGMCTPTNPERMSTPPPPARQSISQDSITESQPSTAPGSPARGNTPEAIAVLVPGDVGQFQEHLRTFIFPDKASGGQLVQQEWRFCVLVLISFLRDNISDMCKSKNQAEREFELQKWRYRCAEPGEAFVKNFDRLLRAFKSQDFGFDCQKLAAVTRDWKFCIFLLDKIVSQKLQDDDQIEWEEEVQKNWFDPENADAAAVFLDRAEPFLGATFGGSKTRCANILGELVPANSYIVFFRMDALTSLLMREHCRVQHALDNKMQFQQVQAGAEHKRHLSTSINTVSLIVSSANWHECFSEHKHPSEARMTELVAGLQQIASLPTVLLDAQQVPVSTVLLDAHKVPVSGARDVGVQVCAEAIASSAA